MKPDPYTRDATLIKEGMNRERECFVWIFSVTDESKGNERKEKRDERK